MKVLGVITAVRLRLLPAPIQDALEIDLIATVLRQLFCPADGKLDELIGKGIAARQLVKGALAFPPRLHQARIQQQPKVRGNARLSHTRNLLQLIDRQLVLLQQGHDAQPRRVRKSPKAFEGGAHFFEDIC